MVVSKRVSYWTVAEVFEWVREQYPSQSKALQQAIAKHAISGRVLLRMKKEQLSRRNWRTSTTSITRAMEEPLQQWRAEKTYTNEGKKENLAKETLSWRESTY
ncbi:hypothetical protein AOLI_G00038910 [Acnodon oligacanthus]